MTITAHSALVLFALVSFFLAFAGLPAGRCNLVALGLFLWLLSTVVR